MFLSNLLSNKSGWWKNRYEWGDETGLKLELSRLRSESADKLSFSELPAPVSGRQSEAIRLKHCLISGQLGQVLPAAMRK